MDKRNFIGDSISGSLQVQRKLNYAGFSLFQGETMTKKISVGTIPDEVLNFVFEEICKIPNGEIIFIAQDACLIQIEIHHKRRLTDWREDIFQRDDKIFAALANKIRQEFSKLDYGQLSIKIQKGHVVQIERIVRHRFTGLDGEGIQGTGSREQGLVVKSKIIVTVKIEIFHTGKVYKSKEFLK